MLQIGVGLKIPQEFASKPISRTCSGRNAEMVPRQVGHSVLYMMTRIIPFLKRNNVSVPYDQKLQHPILRQWCISLRDLRTTTPLDLPIEVIIGRSNN